LKIKKSEIKALIKEVLKEKMLNERPGKPRRERWDAFTDKGDPILTTRSSLKFAQPEKNEFVSDWLSDSKGGGWITLVKFKADPYGAIKKDKTIAIAGAGDPSKGSDASNHKIGDERSFIHDQSRKEIGRGTILGHVQLKYVQAAEAKLRQLAGKPSVALYVYK